MPIFNRVLAALLGLTLASGTAAFAVDCEYCQKPIEGQPYVLKAGKKSAFFKCVFCAIADAEQYSGDLSIISPSENPKQPVVLKRVKQKWSAFPAGAAFVSSPKPKHRICGEQYRAFTSWAAAQKYIAQNAELVEAKPLTLAQIIAFSSS
jgi:hypothetical protein